MKYIELFAGIGGFRIGIERATEFHNALGVTHEGHTHPSRYLPNHTGYLPQTGRLSATCVFANEWDRYAAQTYNKNFGGHIDQRDLSTIPTSDIPDHDLLVGGFPCQAFSVAGKRAGFDDTRGTMFFEVARILADKKPQHLLLENVKGLLSHDEGRTFQTILGVLADLGYRVEWQVLNSKDLGVPQNRERILIVGHLGACCGRQVFPIGDDSHSIDGIQGQHSNTLTTRYYGGQANGTYVIESELDAQITQLNQPKHSNDRVYGADGISPTLNTMQGGMRQPFVFAERGRYNEYGKTEQKAEPRYDGVSNTITQVEKDNRLAVDGRIRRLTPVECERLQGFPDNWTKHGLNPDGVTVLTSDTQRYKMCGNAVTTNVIEAVAKCL